MNTQTPLKIKLSAVEPVSLLTAADAPRSFKGVANSGKPFGYGGYQTVIDFDGLKHKPKMPVLLEHSPVKMAGVCSLSVTSDGLMAEGTLLDNEHGNEIAAAADQGFPWEMSVYVQAAAYEELSAGATETVNGHEVTGPVVIMRQCTIREVSFTAVGVDGNTEAVVLSDGAPFKPFANLELSMTKDEQAAFDALKAEVAALKEEKAALQAEADKAKAEKKKADVAAKLSAAGFKEKDGGWDGLSQATVNLLLSADPEAAAAMIADLKPTPAAAAIPPALLSDSPAAPAEENGVKLSAATLTSTFNKGASYV